MLATSCFSRNDVGVGLTSKVVDALPFGVITCARSFDSVLAKPNYIKANLK